MEKKNTWHLAEKKALVFLSKEIRVEERMNEERHVKWQEAGKNTTNGCRNTKTFSSLLLYVCVCMCVNKSNIHDAFFNLTL